MAAVKAEEVEMIKITLIQNIKYGDKAYKIGEKIEIKKDDLEEFKKAKVIKEE
ncbi:MAG: hypothetical protein K0S61_3997 [Anaerocolumna sp.]|jgi:hypothetical protein|nr:hypothetical protein [Anaerocolumna sp.]